MRPRALLIIATVLVLGAGAVYQFGASPFGKAEPEKKSQPKPQPPVPVTVARASLRDMPVILEVVGRGEAHESITLKSRVDGQVIEAPFAEGRRVAAGDVLIRLDPADFKARQALAEANLARDQALLRKARADVTRYQALREQGFISEEKLAEIRAIAEAAEAAVAADKAALELARLQLSYTILRAPFAGVVGAKLAHPGATVKINETELVSLNRIRPLYVSFAVPEKHLPRIRAAHDKAGVQVRVTLPGHDDQAFSGPIRFIDNAVDAATGTIRMKAELANPAETLTPGQYMSVGLVLDTLRGAVVVPTEAVQQGPEGAFVYVVGADAGTQVRRVEVSAQRDGWSAVARGLAEGETVVTDGHSRLVPGARVKARGAEPGKDGKPPAPGH